MVWKPEYQAAREVREAANPELREKRIQSAKDSYARRKEERKEYMKAYYTAKPEKFQKTPEQNVQRNARRRKRYAEDAKHREKMRLESRQWQAANPEKRKAQRLKTHGIGLSDYQDMLAIQNGACAICGHSDTSNPKLFPVVDHCHETGIIRGLLCMNCNQGLGKFKDSPELLMTAAAYLVKHG